MPTSPTPLRILIADDNPVVRAGLTALLDAREDIHVVAEATDGQEALAAAERSRPDVVLLDVRMPGVDGISALPHLAKVAPVMMLTYSSENEVVQEALRLGAGGYVVHGEFTADQLVAAVRDLQAGRAYFTTSAQNALLAHMRADRHEGGTATAGAHPLPDGLGTAYTTAVPHGGRTTTAQNSGGHGWEPPVSSSKSSRQTASQVQPVVAHYSSRHTRSTVNKRQFGLSSREVEVMDLIAAGMSNQQIAVTCFISEKTVKNHINRIFAKLHSASRSEAIATWIGTRTATGGIGSGGGVIGHG
ncbi:DNA-binding NarL/FixJ family response regulator [Streptomyces candidus]|uniref:DNA-binding NarL/FixJ family response regulator n=2 Tax=Streptomyces candidus TaxID=67283 RepID=A0A7X0HFF6_9ACTN|nr:response regulator transcription factor [Streptomyces candidus]MBB6435188.1 DNA-binding NarL/FixJ family response regulator [Streptomyces candidus]GHH40533.1 DNA-binding response regulator [Streptomyces candidus]